MIDLSFLFLVFVQNHKNLIMKKSGERSPIIYDKSGSHQKKKDHSKIRLYTLQNGPLTLSLSKKRKKTNQHTLETLAEEYKLQIVNNSYGL